MLRKALVAGATAIALGSVLPAQAQFSVLVTDFEDRSWTPFVTEVMFNNPSDARGFFGVDLDAFNSSDITDISIDTLASPVSGTRNSTVLYDWINPASPAAFARVITFDADNLPNPAVHLEGKIRFWMSAQGFTDGNLGTTADGGTLRVGIDIRETGLGIPLGLDGGESGPVEWVAERIDRWYLAGENGISDTTADPESDDVQLVAVGQPADFGIPVIGAGPDGILQTVAEGDDVLQTAPIGLFEVPVDGVMRQYEFDLAALNASGNVFGLTGDGVLSATPNNRGAFNGFFINNDPANAGLGAQTMIINIDDVEFEAPLPDPPVISVDPAPLPLGTEITVVAIDPDATFVELAQVNLDGSETLLASTDPAGADSVALPVPPLKPSLGIVARQTVDGVVSDNSSAVRVTTPGNGPIRLAMATRETDAFDGDLECGDQGTGFDPNQPATLEFIGASGTAAFGVPDGIPVSPSTEWVEVEFNPCDETFGVFLFSGNGELNINPTGTTKGTWEGLYFRIDDNLPAVGPFSVFVDDLIVVNGEGPGEDCILDDFDTYEVADYILAGANELADTTATGDDEQFVSAGAGAGAGQQVIGPGPNGVLDTEPEGDDFVSPTHARFRQPGVAGTSIGLSGTPSRTAITDVESFSGPNSLQIEFAFSSSANPNSHLRLTTDGSVDLLPDTFLSNPNSVITYSTDGTLCDGVNDVSYRMMMKLPPPPVPADCDGDSDVDLADYACLQACAGATVTPGDDCETFDIAPLGTPDGSVDGADFDLFGQIMIGPISG